MVGSNEGEVAALVILAFVPVTLEALAFEMIGFRSAGCFEEFTVTLLDARVFAMAFSA